MNVATITMDKDKAREKLRAFRAERHKDADEFYRGCEAGYSALAEGTPLIRLDEAIRNGGFFDDMRPKLAIARADREQVFFRWNAHSTTAQFNANKSHRWGRQFESLMCDVDLKQQHGMKYSGGKYDKTVEGFARVPAVPADARPATGQLRDWFILWEVEEWADKPFTAEPPRDPFLLKHIGGQLYAVLAEWDLTELERAVMGSLIQ